MTSVIVFVMNNTKICIEYKKGHLTIERILIIHLLKFVKMKTRINFRLIPLLKILIVFLITSTSISAQNFWGIQAGTNFAKMRTSEKEVNKEMKMSPGLFISVPLEFGVYKNFAIQISPSFIQKGYKLDFSGDDGSSSYSSNFRLNVNYFELPVLAKLNFGETRIQYHALFGPSIGYAASGRTKETITENDVTTDYNEKLEFGSDAYPRFDFALNAAVGITFERFGFDVGYSYGLKDMMLNSNNSFFTMPKMYNDGLQLSLSYMMPMKMR